METGTHRESSVIYLHCTPTLWSYTEIRTRTTLKREWGRDYNSQLIGKIQQPILSTMSLTYSLNNFGTTISPFKKNCASLSLTHWHRLKASAWPWGLHTAWVSFNFTYLSHQKFLFDGTKEGVLLSFQCCWLMKTELMNRKIELRTYWHLRGLEGCGAQQHPLVARTGSIQQVKVV